MHILINVVVYCSIFLFCRVIVCIALPTPLLLLFFIVLVILLILTVQADAVLTARDSLIETQTVLLLTVRFFTSAKDKILHGWLVTVDLFEIMHVLAVFLL